ncbi:MAG TPA: hypothetical protein PK239_12115, partial [Chitinophagales bacterium]|nr:hypothetical protein [Chitinophagales bacterium]
MNRKLLAIACLTVFYVQIATATSSTFNETVKAINEVQPNSIPAKQIHSSSAITPHKKVLALFSSHKAEDNINVESGKWGQLHVGWSQETVHPEIAVSEQSIKSLASLYIAVEASDYTAECDGLGNTVELDNWLNSNGGADAADACGNVTWTNDFTGMTTSCGSSGSVTVVFTATDECNNTATTGATFTIQDTQAPLITTTASDYTAECDGLGNTVELDNWLN